MNAKFNLDDQAIIDELGINSSSDEFKLQTLTRIGQLLDERVAIRIETLLTADELAEINALGDDQAKFVAYIQAHVPDSAEIVADELQAIIGELKAVL